VRKTNPANVSCVAAALGSGAKITFDALLDGTRDTLVVGQKRPQTIAASGKNLKRNVNNICCLVEQ